MGKEIIRTKSSKPSGKAVEIDWEKVAEVTGTLRAEDELPENAITVEMYSKKFGVRRSRASQCLDILRDSGKYKEGVLRKGQTRIKYVVPC